MDGTERVLPLATLRTCTFTVLLAAILHARGDLATALERSSTSFGIAAFAVLWATTAFSTRYGLRQVQSSAETRFDAVGWTIIAGGLNGVLVWSVIVLALVGVMLAGGSFASGAPSRALPALMLVAIALPVGSVVAFTVGVVVGAFYGVLELVLDAGSRRLWRLVAEFSPR